MNGRHSLGLLARVALLCVLLTACAVVVAVYG